MTSPVEALHAELLDLLGAKGVSVELAARERASVDGSRMSPVISELLPLGLAVLFTPVGLGPWPWPWPWSCSWHGR